MIPLRSLSLAAALSVVLACSASANEVRRAVVVLESDDPGSRDAALAAIAGAGGRVVHEFDGLLVVDVPAAQAHDVAELELVSEMTEAALPAEDVHLRSDTFRLGLAVWNAVLRDGAEPSTGTDRSIPNEPFGGDHAFVPPAAPEGAVAASVAHAAAAGTGGSILLDRAGSGAPFALAGAPFGAAAENTSEFLAGRVTINLVLMESDGTIDAQTENWSADREALVVSNVVAALDWLRGQEPQARLSFTYHLYSGRTDTRARTGYEPIKRSADPHGAAGEALWLPQLLGKLGYASGDRWVRSRAFAHASRLIDGSDWAVNVFVADSLQDIDGRFADGYFAYTWVGGPHVVLTYDNQNWGVGRMFMVLRHEMLHAFYAFDEYASSGCVCSASRGYLNGPGSNCSACNAAADACVMIANGDDLCAATRRQIGWADLDGDGVVDVVGQDPAAFVDPAPAAVCGPLAVTGIASVVAATNLNPVTTTPRRSISVARIAGVEVRDGEQDWIPAQPTDGAWDGAVERFTAVMPPGPGVRRIELRARDDYGNVAPAPSVLNVTIHPQTAAIPGALKILRSGGAIRLWWPEAQGASAYRIDAAPSAAGPWSEAGETDQPYWIDDPEATAFYRVAAVDACGAPQP